MYGVVVLLILLLFIERIKAVLGLRLWLHNGIPRNSHTAFDKVSVVAVTAVDLFPLQAGFMTHCGFCSGYFSSVSFLKGLFLIYFFL